MREREWGGFVWRVCSFNHSPPTRHQHTHTHYTHQHTHQPPTTTPFLLTPNHPPPNTHTRTRTHSHSAVACLWSAFATVIFCLPTELPVHPDNLNYASVALVGTFSLSNLWFFFPRYGAYKWFTGPHRTVGEADDDGGGGVGGGVGPAGGTGKDVEAT